MPDLSVKEVRYTGQNGKPAVALYMVNPKRERFCQLMASGGYTQTAAYCEAFDKPSETEADRQYAAECASRLANDTDVVLRIQELKKPVIRRLQRKFEYNVQKALEQCQTALDLAYAQGDPKTLLKAIELQSKLVKILGEEINVNHRYGVLDDASTQVLLEMRKELEVRHSKRKNALEITARNVETVPEAPHNPAR
jgi:hypothetical protein